MTRIGERLRLRREELGFTVEDIAEATNFRPETIRAVEDGRTGVFPAEAYRRTFMKAYAALLDLDPADILRDERSEEELAQEAIRGLKIRPHRRADLKKVLVVLAVAAVVVVGALVLSGRLWSPVESVRPADESVAETTAAGADSSPAVPPEPSTMTDEEGETSAEDRIPAREAAGPEGGEAEQAAVVPAAGEAQPEAKQVESEGDTGAVLKEAPRIAYREPMTEAGPDATLREEVTVGIPPPSEGSEAGRAVPAQPDTAGMDRSPIEAIEAGEAGDVSELELRVRERSAWVRLRAGARVLVDTMLSPPYVETFRSSKQFFVDYITDRDAVVLRLNGEAVVFPPSRDAEDKAISGFPVRPRD